MFCTRCGAATAEKAHYCAACGLPLNHTPLMPMQNRLAGHLRLLGILWVGLSALRLVPGLVLWIMVENGVFWRNGAPPFLSPLLGSIAAGLLIFALVGLVTGWGLLTKQPWARMAAIFLGSVNLIAVPFGTMLGIYTLWVLLPAESEQHYEQMTRLEPAHTQQ